MKFGTIVSDDTTISYPFSSFEEFKYFKTTLTTGSNGTFYGCSVLESLEFPHGVTTIGQYVLYGCNSLNWVTFPSTLTTIAPYNFNSNSNYVSNLHNINFRGTFQQWLNVNIQNVGWPPGIAGIHFYLNDVEMTSFNFPSNLTTIKQATCYGMKYVIGDLIIPDTVTTIGDSAFFNCSGLTNVISSDASIGQNTFRGSGNGTGVLHVKGTVTSTQGTISHFKKVIFNKNALVNGSASFLTYNGAAEIVRIGNNWDIARNTFGLGYEKPLNLRFFEVGNEVLTNGYAIVGGGWSTSGTPTIITHFSKSTIPFAKATTNRFANFFANVSNIYIGTGESQSGDQTVLDTYLQDTDWATYQSKMDLWYNYNGIYRTYTVTNSLTNVNNTNVVGYPYITRNESYETTLVEDEGYTLSSVQVLMYEAVDDGSTPANPTDITNSVYDSDTHKILIPQVKGNITIIAMAS